MARPGGHAAVSTFGKAKAGSETPEQKVERLRKEVGDYQARERVGHSYSLPQPKRSGTTDRQVDPRVLRKQYEEDVRRMQLELHQRYEVQMQKTHLQYQHLTLELNRQRQLQRDRHRQIEDIFNGSDGKGMTVVTISAIPGAKVLDVRGTVTGACTMHALPEDATPEELREAPVNARREAYADLILEARRLGANAIVNFKWRNLHVGYDSVEVTAEGTALKVQSDKQDQHCQQCKGGGKGGKNKDHQYNHQQNQQGGKKGKGKEQSQYDDDTDSEEGDSEEEKWNNGQKGEKQKNKNNGKQQGGGKQNNGGGKGDKNLSTIEQLVKVLMESKIKDDQKSKAEKQKNDFMNMLGKFFEDQQYNTSKEALFEWTKNFDNDNKGNSKGQGPSQGQKGQSDGWADNSNNTSGGQAQAEIGWGNDATDNNASTSQAPTTWGDADKPPTSSNDQKGGKGNQQKGKDGKNNNNKNGQNQKGNQGGGKGQQKQDDDPWGGATSTDKPTEPTTDNGWGSSAPAQAQENDAWG